MIIILVALNILLHFVFTSFTENDGTSVVSHRGAAAIAPENTLSGVRAAVETGAPFIEVDVRMSKDGTLLLMHDSTVNRTTDGRGRVETLSWRYLSGLSAGEWFSEEFSEERVPSLSAVLGYMKGKSSELVIEVKSPGRYPSIDKALLETLRIQDMERDVVLISFDGNWIERTGHNIPDAKLGVLYIYPYSLPPAEEVRYVSVFWPSLVIDPTLVWRLKAKGFKVWAWNVDSSPLAKFLIWKGIDGLTLDRPGLIVNN